MNYLTGIISTDQGQGTGAYVVLEHLLKAWEEPGQLLIMAPPASHLAGVAGSLGFDLVPLRSRQDRLVENNRKALREFRSFAGCGSLHAWHSRGFEVAVCLGRKLGLPVSATLHDHPGNQTHSWLRRRIMCRAARRMDQTMAVSDAVGRAWLDAGLKRLPLTIYNGLVGSAPTARSRTGSSPVRVGFLGMYAPMKGFSPVTRLMSRLAGDPVTWHLYGNVHPSIRRDLERAEAELPGKLEAKGRVPSDEIFAEIDILVHASTAFDSFPTVLLESARSGIPVVATSLGGAGEIVEDGHTGYLVDRVDSDQAVAHLRALAGDAKLRASMGQAARERFCTNFQADRMVKGYRSAWTDLVRHQGNHPREP